MSDSEEIDIEVSFYHEFRYANSIMADVLAKQGVDRLVSRVGVIM